MLLREQSLLWQWGNIEKVPAGAGTAAAVGKYREGSCWSRHYYGSEENSWWGKNKVQGFFICHIIVIQGIIRSEM